MPHQRFLEKLAEEPALFGFFLAAEQRGIDAENDRRRAAFSTFGSLLQLYRMGAGDARLLSRGEKEKLMRLFDAPLNIEELKRVTEKMQPMDQIVALISADVKETSRLSVFNRYALLPRFAK